MRLWKIYCMEEEYPGLWQHWYRNQCVAVGFAPFDFRPYWGCKLRGESAAKRRGWGTVRSALLRIEVGDYVIASLRGHRIGRIGQVAEKHVEDDEWNPLVPESKLWPRGQMGRRILVRWDLACGPDNRDQVVSLPYGSRLTAGELRPTIAEIRSCDIDALSRLMNDQANWVGLASRFAYERALSDYIAAYPHRLEAGLEPYPDSKIREKVFRDKKRLDVLLLDQGRQPVIVECKQGAPTTDNLEQLRGYMKSLQIETGHSSVRGILVHGGSRNIHRDVAAAAARSPKIDVVQYQLRVDFAGGR